MQSLLDKALSIATKAHTSQKDKCGVDYIRHPITVASYVKSEEEKIVAYLHDVVEDTDVTLDDLRSEGFNESVVFAIDCLTKRDNELLNDYLSRVTQSPLALNVKLADMKHNSDVTRYQNPKPCDIERCKKYKKQIETLKKMSIQK